MTEVTFDTFTETLPAEDQTQRVQAKFGIVADAGFQAVPDVLLLNQSNLKLRSEDLNVLLQITTHWYDPSKLPFPWTTTIAKRMGVSARTVQRSIGRLVKLDLVKRVKRLDGKTAYDLAPLVARLRPYAVDRLRSRQRLSTRKKTDGEMDAG